MQLAPAAKLVHFVGSNHHFLPCYQSWRCHLAQKILKPSGISAKLVKGHTVINIVDPNVLVPKRHHISLDPVSNASLDAQYTMVHCITRPGQHNQYGSLSAGRRLTAKKSVHKAWRKWLLFQMCRYWYNTTGITESQEKYVSTKEIQ